MAEKGPRIGKLLRRRGRIGEKIKSRKIEEREMKSRRNWSLSKSYRSLSRRGQGEAKPTKDTHVLNGGAPWPVKLRGEGCGKDLRKDAPGDDSSDAHYPSPSGRLPTRPTSASSIPKRLGSMDLPALLC